MLDKKPFILLQFLCSEKASHKIFVCSSSVPEHAEMKGYDGMIVDHDKVRVAITLCLVEPLRQLLEKCKHTLRVSISSKQSAWMTTEIENICKHMPSEITKEDTTSSSTNPAGHQTQVPASVKDYLFRYFLLHLDFICDLVN